MSAPPYLTRSSEIARATGMDEAYVVEKLAAISACTGPDPSLERMIQALLVHETYFFRHPGQWVMLHDLLLGELCASRRGKPLRIWSAGCSTGEEVWSLVWLLDHLGIATAQISGSDLGVQAIRVATAGFYKRLEQMGSFRKIPAFAERYFPSRSGETWTADERLRQRTRFGVRNALLGPVTTELDLVMCRNMLIYFRHDAARRVIEAIARVMAPGGLLLLGAAEVLREQSLFEPIFGDDAIIYRRTREPV